MKEEEIAKQIAKYNSLEGLAEMQQEIQRKNKEDVLRREAEKLLAENERLSHLFDDIPDC